MITIDDLTTPTENIANWVEDYPVARPKPPAAAPPPPSPAPALEQPQSPQPFTIHFAIDPYEFMKTVYECIRPFDQACVVLNDTLRAWRAIHCPPEPLRA